MRFSAAMMRVLPLLAGAAAATTSAQTPAPASQAMAIPADAALATLLRQADVLMRSGKAAEAYRLLEPREEDYSGEIAFDYLLGVVALDIGKPDRATIAFERVLNTNPNFSGARLDLARAYFAMGSDDLAKNEFQIVLRQGPPENAREVINKYLANIEARQLARIQHLSGYLETSMAADSNVTAVTTDFTNGVQNTYGIPGVLPTGSSVVRSGLASGLAGGINFTRLVNEEQGVSLFVGADLRQKIYNISALNSSNLDLRGGASLARGDDSYRLYLAWGLYRQTGLTAEVNANRDAPSVGAEWSRKLGERDQLTVNAQFSKPRYATQNTQDTDQLTLSASLLHIFAGSYAPLVFANLSRSDDRAIRPLATGSDVSRTTTAIRAYMQMSPVAQTELFLTGGLSLRQDDSPNGRSALTPPIYGRDLSKDLALGINWRPRPAWTVKGQVAAYRNDSNLLLYQYRRSESTISLRYDF